MAQPPPRPDALDPVDVNRALAELHDMHREGELPADVVEILDALQARVPATEVARELGVPDHRIHHHQQELRDRFRTRLRKAGLQAVVTLVGVAAVGVLGWHFRTMSGLGPAPVAVVDAGQAPSPTAPPPTALVRVDPRRKQIDSLLKEAEAALSKDDWKRCYEVLGALAAMDAGVPDRTEPLQKACADVHNREFSVKTK